MTLRRKTLITVSAVFIGLLIILYSISQTLLMNSFTKLEEQSARKSVEQALNALSHDLFMLKMVTTDWAVWDDTYVFIEDINQNYIQANLVDASFTGLSLNLMLFINSSGRMVYSKAFDLYNEEEVAVPPSLLSYLTPGDLLVSHSDPESIVSGIILLPENPLLIVSSPILTSEEEGPVRGALILGRYLDSSEIERLAEQTSLSLNIQRYNYSPMPDDFQMAVSSLSEKIPVLIRPLDEQSIAGYALIRDIYDKPALLLVVDMSRDIYAQGQDTVSYFILSLLAIGVVLGVAVMLFLDRQVLSRLTRLNQGVSNIGTSGNLSVRVPVTGEDELSNLGVAINVMLESLGQSNDMLKRKNEQLDAQAKDLHSQAEELRSEITQRKQAEEARKESEEKLETILENTNDVIFQLSPLGTIQYVSPKVQEIYGYKPEDLIGKHLKKTTPVSELPKALKVLTSVLSWKTINNFEINQLDANGKIIPVEINLVPVAKDGKIIAAQGVMRNVSKRKRMEHELQEKNEQLDAQNEELQSQTEELMTQQQELIEKTREVERANQLKSEFLANMSHELRTPLNVITGFSELMVDEVPGEINEEQRQCLTDVLTSSRHLLNLINGVLDLSRVESGKVELKPENVALTEVIASLARTMMPILTPRKQSLDVEIEEGLPLVYVDEGKLAQVLLNLVDNASKFSPDGSKMKIEAIRKGDWCQVSVIDNGIGIKKEDQERIFEPFSRLDNPLVKDRGGTGLGLALVKQIVGRYGGQVWVESEYGEGSRFTFTIPLATSG